MSRSRSSRSWRRRTSLAAMVSAAALTPFVAPAVSAGATAPHTASHSGFAQVNLVSDVPGLAQVTDFRMSNPWGITMGPSTPLWVNNDNTATSQVWAGANGKDPISLKLTVQTPADPTGIAFNGTGAFAAKQGNTSVPTLFLFNGQDGYTSGWGPTATPPTMAVPTNFVRDNGYLGMAVATTPSGPRMYVTSFAGVQVFDGSFHQIQSSTAFIDPQVPAGLAPYNVAVLGNRVFVTYAVPGGGPGGAIAVFTFKGRFLRQLSADPHLVAPWGITAAPPHWTHLGGRLLVGNVDDGRISVFSRTTGAFKGQLRDSHGNVIVNDGLWGLAFGNGVTGTPQDLLFAAGIDGYAHGLLGMIHHN
jgi:uncharacterized protein (TIGR03118 family)